MKIAVSGASGRMGRRIIALGHEHPDIDISGALESVNHVFLGRDAGEVAGVGPIGVHISSDEELVVNSADVLIDFSAPDPSLDHVRLAAKLGKALVVGTTGFSEAQKSEIRKIGSQTRCLVAPNMSLGVNLLFKLAAETARTLGQGYDVEIVETHHRMKKDAPSGTAIRLAEVVAEALSLDLGTAGVYGRRGLVGERDAGQIGVMALRAGDIVGEHTVMFAAGGERIELIHRAHSRDALARGALQAALWLVSKPNGLYDMQDVLSLKEPK